MQKNYGWFSSMETMGAVDGPGLRLVIFLQGCALRCLFCHNPETIPYLEEKKITVDEIVELYNKNISFYRNGGGVTISGGDPIGQADFLITLLERLKEEGIHSAIDTALGAYRGRKIEKINKVAELADLFLVDVKHPDTNICRELTGVGNEPQYEFIKYLEAIEKTYWIRHVYVPTFSDRNIQDMYSLGKYMGNLKHMEKFEILPYHNMMIPKYEQLGIEFKLHDVEPPTEEMIKNVMDHIRRGVADAKKSE